MKSYHRTTRQPRAAKQAAKARFSTDVRRCPIQMISADQSAQGLTVMLISSNELPYVD